MLRYVASVRAVSANSPANVGIASASPEVYPFSGATDLLGRMPVRLTAEDGDLVAYGFENQRIAIPAAEIGAMYVHRGWGKSWGRSGPALAVLDKQDRMLLRAPGIWGAAARGTMSGYGSAISGFGELCGGLGINRPQYLTLRQTRRQKPRWQRAPSYRQLRIRSRGYMFTRLALVCFGLVVAGLGIAAGVLLAHQLPPGVGDVRDMIGVLLCVAAVFGTFWLCGCTLRALNWLAVSWNVHTLAPPGRFFGTAYRGRTRKAQAWLTMTMIFAIPALVAWGPIVGLVSLAHGFSDQALVSKLRQDGVSTRGFVIDAPTYSTDNEGNTVVTDHPTLLFQDTGSARVVKTPDPAIAGWTWPMDSAQIVTIVYDPSDPSTAAVAGQISGSPWHGAPTGNIVAGALLTLALAPLTWLTVRRIRNARRESREGMFEAIG